MAAKRRLTKEFQDLRTHNPKWFGGIILDDQNFLHWQVLLMPEHPPYNKGAFLLDVVFPIEYPFKPPKINLHTKIYHPNINEEGQVCLNIMKADNWKPATKIEDVIRSLLELINEPEPDHYCYTLRADLAEEFTKDKRKFMKNAEEFTKQHAEKRPE
ncbi:putative Ubiquitin-conjugating enzyme E2 L3 [Hypsibius exemplaris]|uniref:E2 ubiquitin-conjugating enzyme n=1 Tax=Hypsibius exemplaris TaxID=2072580 RepID=A0A1W0X5I5_HYPEX|nr:putative Ubiquitin-conjugating enzyme E2 L3 [Hypsibius exemplaris]